MGLTVGKVIIMRLLGDEWVKATVAYILFTMTIGSVGYEARHVSDPCVVTFFPFLVLRGGGGLRGAGVLCGQRYSMVKASSVFPGSTAYRFIEISGFCSSKRGICFGDIGNSIPLTFSDVLWGL